MGGCVYARDLVHVLHCVIKNKLKLRDEPKSKITTGATIDVTKDEKEWSASDSLCEVFALQGMRNHMEDRYCMMADEENHLYLYGVFDGHGGEAAAEYAEKKLFPAILNKIQKSKPIAISSIQEILKSEILELDEAFVKESKKVRNYSGTTCLVAIIFRDTLIVANVGDSRGVMSNRNKRVIPLSHDHKPQQLKEQKRIKDAGGFISFNGVWRVAGILATSRALGDYPLKERNLVTAEPDILTFNLTQHQSTYFVLASDGLWDAFSNEDAVSFLSQRENLQGASQDIARKAHKKGSADNITVMVVDLTKYKYLQESMDSQVQDRERVAKMQAEQLIKTVKEKAEKKVITVQEMEEEQKGNI